MACQGLLFAIAEIAKTSRHRPPPNAQLPFLVANSRLVFEFAFFYISRKSAGRVQSQQGCHVPNDLRSLERKIYGYLRSHSRTTPPASSSRWLRKLPRAWKFEAATLLAGRETDSPNDARSLGSFDFQFRWLLFQFRWLLSTFSSAAVGWLSRPQ